MYGLVLYRRRVQFDDGMHFGLERPPLLLGSTLPPFCLEAPVMIAPVMTHCLGLRFRKMRHCILFIRYRTEERLFMLLLGAWHERYRYKCTVQLHVLASPAIAIKGICHMYGSD